MRAWITSAGCSHLRSGTDRPAPAPRARSARRQAALLDAGRRTACSSARRSSRMLASGLVRAEANEAALPELLGTRYLSGDEPCSRASTGCCPDIARLPGRRVTSEVLGRAGRHEPEATRDRDDEAVERFRALLEESVRIRLMADVPLGMFLSGGLDSSAIAALMARLIERPLQTFSVAFKDRAFNELDYARAGREAIGADAHEIVIDDRGFLRRPSSSDLARGRTDRASVERAALLRLGSRVATTSRSC